jgi:hypothetical protein
MSNKKLLKQLQASWQDRWSNNYLHQIIILPERAADEAASFRVQKVCENGNPALVGADQGASAFLVVQLQRLASFHPRDVFLEYLARSVSFEQLETLV